MGDNYVAGAEPLSGAESSVPRPSVSVVPTASEMIRAQIQREMDEFQAVEDAVEASVASLASRSRRKVAGPSTVFSIRLDHGELELLERQAALRGLKPSVYARNVIRWGLAQADGVQIDRAIQQVEDAVAALRTVVAN